MLTRCSLHIPVPDRAMLACQAGRLLQTQTAQFYRLGLKTQLRRFQHRLDRGTHYHRYSYIPIVLFHYYALSMPWRGLKLVAVPEQAIRDAEERGELSDEIFVLWATERNARVLAMLTRRPGYAADPKLRKRIAALQTKRRAMEKACVDAITWKDRNGNVVGGSGR